MRDLATRYFNIFTKRRFNRYVIIGGIATLVGTPPNLSFVRIFAIQFPEAPEISFASWFIFVFPSRWCCC